jgi:NAD(P)-dependent dehydrogenase (short-subunit alcohol dehydrogenase family)
MDLTNRVVLLTGGRRIGAVVARMLAAHGADVALAYLRSRAEADETAAAIREAGRRALVIRADLSQPAEAQRLVAEAATTLGRLDVLINMASVYRAQPFDQMQSADWEAGLAVDLNAVFHCSRAAVPYMRAAGGGRIINFSDWLALSHRPRYKGYLAYYVAKAGVIGLTEALSLELAEHGILVNAIAPGPILPPPDLGDDELGAVEKATLVGRWGGEEEIGKVVRLLIESDFMTGEVVRVDGGRHIR